MTAVAFLKYSATSSSVAESGNTFLRPLISYTFIIVKNRFDLSFQRASHDVPGRYLFGDASYKDIKLRSVLLNASAFKCQPALLPNQFTYREIESPEVYLDLHI